LVTITTQIITIIKVKDVNNSIFQLKSEITTKETTPKSTNSIVIGSVDENETQFLTGTLKKEKIPVELDLGDYWYWLYFDNSALLLNNAMGYPLYIDKIQVVLGEAKDLYSLDEFDGKKVEVFGKQSWGYAESSIFEVYAIKTTN